MACPIITSLSKGCRDARGGMEIFYVTELGNLTQASVTIASGVITNTTSFLTTGKKFWTIQVEQFTASEVENINAVRATGTLSIDPNINMYIPKKQAAVSQFIMTLAQNDLVFIGKDNNGTLRMYGLTKGMALVPSTAPSGVQMSGEQTGYVLAFAGSEAAFAPEISTTLLAALLVAP